MEGLVRASRVCRSRRSTRGGSASILHTGVPTSTLFGGRSDISLGTRVLRDVDRDVPGSPFGRVSTLSRARVASPSDTPTMSPALLGSGAFLSPRPLAAPSPRPPRRARVLVAPSAKGQKGVRKIAQAPGQEQFAPGTALSKMMNLRLNKINWKVLSDASDKLDGELASQPILGLVRAEVLLRGVDELQREGRGYKEYILLRSLGLKAWFTMATSRAGIVDPVERCAVGKALADPAGEHNIYRRVLAHAPRAAEGDWTGFADGLAEDARAAANAITEEDTKTVKVRYDAAVTAAHFEFIEAEIAAAARVAADARARRRQSRDGRRPRAVDRSGRRAEDRGRGGDGRCGKWHVIRRRPSRGGGGGGGGGHRVDVWQKIQKEEEESRRGRRRARCRRRRGGKDALPGRRAESAREETDRADVPGRVRVVRGERAGHRERSDRRGGGDGARVAPRRRGGRPVRTLRLRVDLRSRRVGRKPRRHLRRARAKEDVAAWGGMEDAAVVFVSFDPSEDVAAERDAKVAAAKATAAGRAVVAAAVALAPGGKCDAVEGPEGAEEAREGAKARLRRRLGL